MSEQAWDFYDKPIDLRPVPKPVDLSQRISPAVAVLKSVQGDRWSMMAESERLKLDLSHDMTLEQMYRKMAAHALDILTGLHETS